MMESDDTPIADSPPSQPAGQDAEAPVLTVASQGTGFPAPTETAPPPPEPYAHLPADLRVPWTWVDLLLFFFFAIGCLLVTSQIAVYVAVVLFQMRPGAGGFALPPSWGVALQLVWYGVLVAYLYLLVRLRFRSPFWQTLGFRPTQMGELGRARSYLLFAFTGMVLAVVVNIISGLVRPQGEVPIEKLFQQRASAVMVLFAAVVVAPVVEELLFRGWLYPVAARTFGVAGGVLITGGLFGLMHGAQLGWSWGLVSLLTFAGVVFTYMRARTGSVVPSYFLHLGYNLIPVIGFLVQTGGLRNMPGSH